MNCGVFNLGTREWKLSQDGEFNLTVKKRKKDEEWNKSTGEFSEFFRRTFGFSEGIFMLCEV